MLEVGLARDWKMMMSLLKIPGPVYGFHKFPSVYMYVSFVIVSVAILVVSDVRHFRHFDDIMGQRQWVVSWFSVMLKLHLSSQKHIQKETYRQATRVIVDQTRGDNQS